MPARNNPCVRIARLVAMFVMAAAIVMSLTSCGSGQTASSVPPGTSAAKLQRFSVDLSTGAYVPNEITAKAGAPVQVTFGEGQGCVQTLVFPHFNINADMTRGPKTFDLGSLQPGEYSWSCGMNMQHGVLKVE